MELFIVTLTGTAFELRVSPNDTVMSIKSKIQRFEGIPVGQQHLIWRDGELSDHQSLRDCSIPGGATLRLVLGMRGGPISTYKPPPISAATATIRFTPTVHFASSSQKENDRINSTDDLSTPMSQSSLLNENNVDSDSHKQITLYFVSAGDKLEFIRLVDRRHHESISSNDHSTTSLLGSEETPEVPHSVNNKPSISSNLLSTSAAAQSLPYLQSDESALTCERLPQLASTISEPSVMKAADTMKSPDCQRSSPANTAIITGYLCAAHGRDSNPYFSDTDDCPSDCGGGAGTAYFLRPPSPEWDNHDLSSTPPPPPPTFDFPFFSAVNEAEDNDSLADLEDCLIYYRSGDVLFGPSATRKSSSTSFLRGGWRGAYGDRESPVMTQAKLEECESLAEKVRLIKAQLLQKKEERMQRRIRQQKFENVRDERPEPSTVDGRKLQSYGAEPTLPLLCKADDYGSPHVPKMHSFGGQCFKKVSLRHPHTANSAVDLPIATIGSNSSSTENLPSKISANSGTPNAGGSLLLPSKRFVSRFLDPERLRVSAPNKTASETNLDAALVIPGFAGANNDGDVHAGSSSSNNSYFSRFGRGFRQRRFGTVQAPDISKIGSSDQLVDFLRTGKEEAEGVGTGVETETGSSRPLLFPPLLRTAATNLGERDRLLKPTPATAVAASLLRGRSPTMRKTVAGCCDSAPTTSAVTLPPISSTPRGNLTRATLGSDHNIEQAAEDKHQSQPPSLASASPSKARKDTSEPPRRSPKLKADRCASCNRKTGLVDTYTCRCERNFCSKHRYAELHACPFDYKADARRYIREANPVVTAAKLPKI